MNGKLKKILSILLIIAMVITSAGFGTFADSIDDVTTASSEESEHAPGQYYKELLENQTSTKIEGEGSTDSSGSTESVESTTVEEPEEDESTTVEEPEEDESTTVAKLETDETSTTNSENEETTTVESSEEETSTTVGASDDEGDSARASSANPNTETTTTKKVEDEETTTIESSSEESTSGTIESSSEESILGTDATSESSSTSDGKKDASTEQSIAPAEQSDVETATVSETNENIGDSTNVATDSNTTENLEETNTLATKSEATFDPASLSELKPIPGTGGTENLFGASYVLSEDLDDNLWTQIDDLFNSNTVLTIGSDIASPDFDQMALKRDSGKEKVQVAEDKDRHYGSIADYWYIKGKWGWTVGHCLPFLKDSDNITVGRNRYIFLGCIALGFDKGGESDAASNCSDAWDNEKNEHDSDVTKQFYYWPTYVFGAAYTPQIWKDNSTITGWWRPGYDTGSYDSKDYKDAFKKGVYLDTQRDWPSNQSSYLTNVPRDIASKLKINGQLKNKSYKELTLDKVSFSATEGALSGNSNLEKVTFTANADITGITNATSFFENDSKLETIVMNKANGFNNITNATKMFKGCTSLKNISFTGNMKMGSVTNTESMFEGCTALETVDLGNMPLSSLTNTKNMFNGCSSLKTIKVGSLIYKLSDSVDATNMFAGCTNLKGPNNFSDTSKTGKDFARVGLGGILPGYFTYTGSSTVGIDFKKLSLPSTSPKSKTQIKKIKFLNGANVPAFDTNGNVVVYTTDGVNFYGQIQGTTLSIHCNSTINLKWPADYSSAFDGWTALETVEGLNMSNMDYSAVTNVSKLFYNTNLTSLTIPSNFCQNATNLSEMFAGSTNLTTITIGNAYNSTNGINMKKMFAGCTNLTTINLPANFGNRTTNMESMFEGTKISSYPTNLNVNAATNMKNMFKDCRYFTTFVTPTGFNPSAATNMSNMFSGCSNVTKIDLKASTFTNLTDASNMFNGCSALTEVKVNTNIRNLPAGATTTNMFAGCTNLKGGAGFKYDPDHTNGDYARVDYGGILPGYFTCSNNNIYNTVRFNVDKTWVDNITKTNITKLVFSTASTIEDYDSEFSLKTMDASLNTKGYLKDGGATLVVHIAPQLKRLYADTDWSEFFANFTNLTTIEGLEAIDGSSVRDMSSAFENCSALTDLSFPNTYGSSITSMENMFKGCSSLTSLDLSRFNTTSITGTNMNNLFDGCSSLTTLTLGTNFRTNGVTELKSIFKDCSALTTIALPTSFTTNTVTNMSDMFNGCSSLTSITGNNILINAATNVSNMFNNCSSLTSVDLKGSTFVNLTDASNMFNGCSTLSEVKVNTNIRNLPAGATTTDMFAGCTNLKGGGGFKYDANHTDGEYARVDYGGILPGYFTCSNNNIYNTVRFNVDKTWVDNITKTDITKVVFSTDSTIEDYENEFNLKTMDVSLNTKGYLKDGGATLVVHIAPQIKDLIADADWSEFFANFSNLQRIEHFDVIDTTNVVNASKAFYNCTSIITIDMSDIKIENIQNLESAFEGCTSLAGFTGKIATFSSLTNAKKTFKDCTSLQIMSFDICDTPTLTTTEEMFAGCTNLARIYTNDNFQGLHGVNYTDMFKDCVNLVGGQGFGYNPTDPNAGSGEFARIDYGGIMPGYYSLIDPSIYNTVTFTVPTDWFHSTTKTKDEITEVVFFNDAPVPGGGSAVGHYDEMFYINPVNKSRAYIDGNKVKFHYGHSINQLKVDGDASGFFKDFTNLTHVEGLEEKVDVTNVTNISELFSGCSNLVEVNLNPNTEHVTNMEKVFYGCEKLEKVTIGSNLKLNKVTNLESAFEGCKKLNTLDIGIASFSSIENLKNAFKDCESLTVFSFDVCDTPTLATTSGMFSGCKNLRRIYVNDNFQGLQHIAYDNMFDGCINLIGGEGFAYSPTVPACKSGEFARVDYGGIMPGYYTIINTAKYHDVVFDLETDWYKSTTLPKEEVRKIKFFNTPQSEGGMGAYDEMFYMSDTDKTRVYVEASTKTIKFHYGHDIDTLKFQGDVEGMFADFINLEEIEGIEKLDASRIVNMSAMFAGCKSMKHLTIPNGLINATTLSEAFKDCSSLETVTFGSDVRVENVTTLDGMFENCTSLKSIDFGTSFDISKVTTMERMFKNCESLTEIKLNQRLTTAKIENMNEMFAGCKNITDESIRVLGVLDVRNVKEMNYTFASCSNLTDLSFGVIEADKIESMEGMFAGCDNLTNITFGGSFNTNNAVNMSHMFEGCTKLQGEIINSKTQNANAENKKEGSNFLLNLLKLNDNDELFGAPANEEYKVLDLSGLKTDSVTNMKGMFANCAEIDVVLLPNINTENVEDMSEMFANCSGLRFIVARDFATASVIHSEDMFKNCPKLMGGEGTKWIDTQVLDKEYAVVDMGAKSGKVGYLTWGNAHIKYNPGEGAEGTMDDDVVERFKTYSLSANGFTKNGYTFVNWMDAEGNTYKNAAKIMVAESINLTAVWKKGGGSTGPSGGGGGGGGGNGGGIMQDYDRAINFVMQTPIYEHEYTWIYDDAGRRVGINLNVDSMVGKAMIKSVRTKGAYGLNQDGKTMQLGGGGVYRIYYKGQEMWFGFDKYNRLMTGFVETSTKTRMLTVATDIVTALVNTESIDADKIFIESAGQVGKYYLYEQDGDLRGQLWYQPIVVKGIQYTFDLTGKVISSTDTPIDQGIWEYNPLEDHWKYFVPDNDGKARYYTDTEFNVYYQGETYKYIFDSNGYLLTGYFNWRGKDYYGLESGQFKGAATEITKK